MEIAPARDVFLRNLLGDNYLGSTDSGRLAWTYETKQFTVIVFENYLHGFRKKRVGMFAKCEQFEELRKDYDSAYFAATPVTVANALRAA